MAKPGNGDRAIRDPKTKKLRGSSAKPIDTSFLTVASSADIDESLDPNLSEKFDAIAAEFGLGGDPRDRDDFVLGGGGPEKTLTLEEIAIARKKHRKQFEDIGDDLDYAFEELQDFNENQGSRPATSVLSHMETLQDHVADYRSFLATHKSDALKDYPTHEAEEHIGAISDHLRAVTKAYNGNLAHYDDEDSVRAAREAVNDVMDAISSLDSFAQSA